MKKLLILLLSMLLLLCCINSSVYAATCEEAFSSCVKDALLLSLGPVPALGVIYADCCFNGYVWCKKYMERK